MLLYSYHCATSAILLVSQRVKIVLAESHTHLLWATTKRSAQLIAIELVPVFVFELSLWANSMSTEHPLHTLSRLKKSNALRGSRDRA